jgi:DNA-3-methyladenine glycosylase II
MRTLSANGPFSLQQAIRFLSGFGPAGVEGLERAYMAAHVFDGHATLVRVTEGPDGALALATNGSEVTAADEDAAERLMRRMFTLDWDGDAFYGRIGEADPVLGELQRRFFGLRPVLFATPFEALCWAIISQRVNLAQATKMKARLAAYGPTIKSEEETYQAFPSPEQLLALDPAKADREMHLPLGKFGRILAAAERGTRGELEAEMLLAMEPDEARAWLERSPGIGPWASEFVLIRGVGHPDLMPHGERRIISAIEHFYELEREPTDAELDSLAERWAGYRSWAAFLLRVAWQAEIS